MPSHSLDASDACRDCGFIHDNGISNGPGLMYMRAATQFQAEWRFTRLSDAQYAYHVTIFLTEKRHSAGFYRVLVSFLLRGDSGSSPGWHR